MRTVRIGLGSSFIRFGPAMLKRAVILAARILKITVFDTAQQYGNGSAELFLGGELQPSDEVYTKIGLAGALHASDSSRWWSFFSPNTLERHLEDSLERLNRTQIDGLLLHCTNSDIDYSNHVSELRRLKESGRVRLIGFSADSEVQIPVDTSWADIIELPVDLLKTQVIDTQVLIVINSIFRNGFDRRGLSAVLETHKANSVVLLVGSRNPIRITASFLRLRSVLEGLDV